MTKDTIVAVLESEGISAKGGAKAFELAEGRGLDCFIRSANDLLTVTRIYRVALQEKFVSFENRKGDRFFFSYDDIVGFRSGAEEGGKDRSAGFFR